MVGAAGYGGLFAASFVAATILPAQSEAVLAAMILSGGYDTTLLLAVATAGNVGGSVVNWGLGRGVSKFEGRRWFPVRREMLARAEGWYARWGRWSLLLSWAPVIGDPLTIAAGLMRERLSVFLLLVTAAKLGRYLAVAAVAERFV